MEQKHRTRPCAWALPTPPHGRTLDLNAVQTQPAAVDPGAVCVLVQVELGRHEHLQPLGRLHWSRRPKQREAVLGAVQLRRAEERRKDAQRKLLAQVVEHPPRLSGLTARNTSRASLSASVYSPPQAAPIRVYLTTLTAPGSVESGLCACVATGLRHRLPPRRGTSSWGLPGAPTETPISTKRRKHAES